MICSVKSPTHHANALFSLLYLTEYNASLGVGCGFTLHEGEDQRRLLIINLLAATEHTTSQL